MYNPIDTGRPTSLFYRWAKRLPVGTFSSLMSNLMTGVMLTEYLFSVPMWLTISAMVDEMARLTRCLHHLLIFAHSNKGQPSKRLLPE